MITLTHTRIAVQILIEDDSGSVTRLMMALTALVALLVSLGNLVNETVLFVADLVEAARFTNALFTIGVKSLAYGLVGVRL